MIKGVFIEELNQFPDNRGRVMHMIRVDNLLFEKFGEVYFSEVFPGVVKAWKRQKSKTQLFAVPIGMIKLVLYDERETYTNKDNLDIIEIGRDKYKLVKIPPMIWYGFQCVSKHAALIVNCTDLPYDSNDIDTLDSRDSYIPYKW
jgi:dTDP-4-dehydrorhamnose 3,5-epimerase